MFKFSRFVLFLLCFLFISNINAQKRSYDNHDYKYEDWDDWDDMDWWEWDFDSRPMIEINYGTSIFEHNIFKGNFSENGLTEFKIGYSSLDKSSRSLVYLHENFIFISKVSPSLKTSIDRSYDFKTELIRGGFGWRNGLGYHTGHLSVIPYTQTGMVWSKLDNNSYPASSDNNLSYQDLRNDIEILNRYADNYRFSVANEAGVKVELGPMLAFSGGYEINTIFPRVKTWEMLGTFGIEYTAYGLLNEFIEEIEFSTPEAAPIVSLVLKSALHYTFYKLRQEDMNWPFNSEAPITYESFKLGMTFTF